MPLPLGVAGGAWSLGNALKSGNVLGAVGFGGQRGRTPAQNRRMRQQQVRDAEAMARAGDDFGVKLLRVWLGELPSLSVSRPDYRSGVAQGKMPADGRTIAQEALDRLKADGVVTASGNLSRAGKRDTGEKRAKAASQGAAARKDTGTRGGPRTRRERTYVRYDPDTGERVEVTRDDWRYDEWTNRRPRRSGSRSSRSTSRRTTYSEPRRSRRKTRSEREVDAAVRRIATEATKAGLNLTASAVRWFAGAAAAAGMSAGAAAALVVGTGLVSYAATRWLIDRIETVTDPAYKREQVALAYRRARLDWEKREGRKLTRTEHDFLARNFKDALKALDAGVTYSPPGA